MKPDDVGISLLDELILHYKLIGEEFSRIGSDSPRFRYFRENFNCKMFSPLCGLYEKNCCEGCPLAYREGEYHMGRCYGTVPYTKFLEAIWTLDLALKRNKELPVLKEFFGGRIREFLDWLGLVKISVVNGSKTARSAEELVDSL